MKILCLFALSLIISFSHTPSVAQQLWGLGQRTIYTVDQNGDNLNTVYFMVDTQDWPTGKLVNALDGKLYGMAYSGIFSFDPQTNSYSKKFTFDEGYPVNESGAGPPTTLSLANNGKLYGMTYSGGANGLGVLFEYDPTTNLYSKKVDLSVAEGHSPLLGGLLQASNGNLYGMTNGGGENGVGVLFEYNLSAGTYIKKVDFEMTSKGGFPIGDLIQASNGKLYGLTPNGGEYGQGVLFEYDVDHNTFVKKIDFQKDVNGAYPFGTLMQAPDGKLYGRTTRGLDDNGTLFQYDLETGLLLTKAQLLSSEVGREARGALVLSPNGNLYGVSREEGPSNTGTLYEYNLSTETVTLKQVVNEPQYTLTVIGAAKSEQSISFAPLENKICGTPKFALTATATSGLMVQYQSSDETVAVISNNEIEILSEGTTIITASQLGDENYDAANPVEQILTVSKGNQLITFNDIPTKTIYDSPFYLDVFSTSGLPISFQNSNENVAAISNNVVTILKPGATFITASQNGNGCYNPAESRIQKLQVNHSQRFDMEDEDSRVVIFPNPATNSITVNVSIEGVSQIALSNTYGAEIISKQISNGETKFDLSGLQKGVYFIEIILNNSVLRKRFLKQ